MAWEDRTPFEAIEENYGLSEAAVIQLMRAELKPHRSDYGELGFLVVKQSTGAS